MRIARRGEKGIKVSLATAIGMANGMDVQRRKTERMKSPREMSRHSEIQRRHYLRNREQILARRRARYATKRQNTGSGRQLQLEEEDS